MSDFPCSLHSPEFQQALRSQKALFCAGKRTDPSIVRDMILRSWERSAESGVTIDNVDQMRLDDNLLGHMREHHRRLIDCTNEVFQHMFSDSSFADSSMMLSNAEGVMLAFFVPKKRGSELPYSSVGIISRENLIGTNGIGTCIAERCPIEIIGAEHYRTMGENWSCSAAPIFDEQQKLIAVLNVSQHWARYHSHTFGMVKAAAYAITEQIRLQALLQRQETIMGLLEDGILELGRDGTIRLMNSHAARILGLPGPVTDCPVTRFIQDSEFLRSLLCTETAIHDKEDRFQFLSGARGCVYSVLPMGNVDDGIILILRESRRMRKVAIQLTGNRATYTFNSILGESPALKKAIAEAKNIAPRMTTVLLQGESGTGKELFAHSIHNASPHASGPFISVNCGAIPRSLLESELFGYEYGAFTGASRSGKPGKFELASGGTIFLDEIGEMALDAQVALLRFLQNREVVRIGGTVSRTADIRVIAATNRNLEQMVHDGTFREDLFYRLNVYPIFIPPLRERRGDVPILARELLAQRSRALKKENFQFEGDVLEAMDDYEWPGNVRELENAVERMINVASGTRITMEDLPQTVRRGVRRTCLNREEEGGSEHTVSQESVGQEAGISSWRSKEELAYIVQMLRKNEYNMRRTAESLGYSRPYLYQKMKKLGIDIRELRELKP